MKKKSSCCFSRVTNQEMKLLKLVDVPLMSLHFKRLVTVFQASYHLWWHFLFTMVHLKALCEQELIRYPCFLLFCWQFCFYIEVTCGFLLKKQLRRLQEFQRDSTYKYISLYRSKGSKGTVVNRAYHSLNGGSCERWTTVPLKRIKLLSFLGNLILPGSPHFASLKP